MSVQPRCDVPPCLDVVVERGVPDRSPPQTPAVAPGARHGLDLAGRGVRPDRATQLQQRRAFGARVRALRAEAGMSQDRLAREAHLERAYISHVENGRRNTSLHTMWQLANALGVNPRRFFEADPAEHA